MAVAPSTQPMTIASPSRRRRMISWMPTSRPSCDVSCTLEDFWKLQSGEANAFELLMDGRVRFGGDAQIAMALSGIFA